MQSIGSPNALFRAPEGGRSKPLREGQGGSRPNWLRAFVTVVALTAGVVLQAAPTITSSASTTFGNTYTATATSGSGALEWSLGVGSTAAGAGIHPDTGRVIYSSVGTVVIRARYAGEANYSPDFTITVGKATITLSLANLLVDYDGNPHAALVTPAAIVSTIAGDAAHHSSSADGVGTAARFTSPGAITIDSSGALYVADSHAIRKISPYAQVTTLAGSLVAGGAVDAVGTNARFQTVGGLAFDSDGNLLAVDIGNNVIRKVTPGGSVSTFAGTLGAPAGNVDGSLAAARFNLPINLALGPTGDVYVADAVGPTIRKISGSNVTTIAGLVGNTGGADGPPQTATFHYPTSLARDLSGRYYVTDQQGATVRRIETDGSVVTVAGAYLQRFEFDGPGATARFRGPWGIAIDTQGTTYVSDFASSTIRKISPEGVVTTVAGVPSSNGFANGAGSNAKFYNPAGLAVDPYGTLYVSDLSNGVIRRVIGAGGTLTVNYTPNGSTTPTTTPPTAAGTYTVNASLSHTNWQGNVTGTLVIDGVNPVIPAINSPTAAAFGSTYNATVSNGGAGIGALEWRLSPDLSATTAPGPAINVNTGTLTTTGIGRVAIQARFAGDAGHIASAYSANYIITITQAGQSAPVISSANSFTFGNSYTATANSGFGALSWALGAGSTATGAAIDPATGAVTATSAGTVVIKVRFAGDTNHFASAYSSDYTITINKASQSAPVISSTSSFILGNNYTATANTGFGALEWSLGTGSTATGASINATTGAVNCTSTGSVVIKARFAGDSSHLASSYSADFSIQVVSGSVPPSINTQPASLVTNTGQAAQFSVTAGGTPAPSYQWQIASGNTWQDIHDNANWSGTNTSTLTIAASATSAYNGASFRCVVTNAGGTASSNGATLTVRETGFLGDFDDDGRADVLWRNNNTGQIASWTSTTGYMHLGYEGSGWLAIGTDDFDGDGRDEVVWRNANTGQIASWTSTAGYIHLGYEGSGWLSIGTDDFDGDGRDEIVWRNANTGQIASWTSTAGYIHLGYEGSGWLAIGTDDFDGDGRTEVVWRNANTGQIASWTSTVGYIHLGYEGSGWITIGTDDFDGDGRVDILWRNTASDEIASWTSTAGYMHLGYEGSGWIAIGADDFDGDGRAEVLWRNANTGQIATYGSTAGFIHIAYEGSGWMPVGI